MLKTLQEEISNKSFAKFLDVTRTEEAMHTLKRLISEMEVVDMIVVNAGTGHINPDLSWSLEKETIDVNVSGFASMLNVAMNYFIKKGSGHLVGISSIAAVRGDGDSPAYNASKSFVSNYLEGMRKKVAKLGIPVAVTDIQPGFVDTAMAKGDGFFWVASPQKAAGQIFSAIKRKKKHAYITRRWRIIGGLLKIMPDFIYNKL